MLVPVRWLVALISAIASLFGARHEAPAGTIAQIPPAPPAAVYPASFPARSSRDGVMICRIPDLPQAAPHPASAGARVFTIKSGLSARPSGGGPRRLN